MTCRRLSARYGCAQPPVHRSQASRLFGGQMFDSLAARHPLGPDQADVRRSGSFERNRPVGCGPPATLYA
jgi:hypothetical protein